MPKILIVEDEAQNVEILSRLLRKKNFDVAVAGAKDQAVAMANSESPDLILMDIGIPNAEGGAWNSNGGLEATLTIRAGETAKKVPILALTSHAMLDDKKRFVDAGCDGVHTKPYIFVELLASIDQLLRR